MESYQEEILRRLKDKPLGITELFWIHHNRFEKYLFYDRLNQLITEGYVKKTDRVYFLTELGKVHYQRETNGAK